MVLVHAPCRIRTHRDDVAMRSSHTAFRRTARTLRLRAPARPRRCDGRKTKEIAVGNTVTYELDDHIATITYNRPDALNAINGEMRRDLNDAFARFRDEEDAWIAIVT